jgi:hypothetical protein
MMFYVSLIVIKKKTQKTCSRYTKDKKKSNQNTTPQKIIKSQRKIERKKKTTELQDSQKTRAHYMFPIGDSLWL